MRFRYFITLILPLFFLVCWKPAGVWQPNMKGVFFSLRGTGFQATLMQQYGDCLWIGCYWDVDKGTRGADIALAFNYANMEFVLQRRDGNGKMKQYIVKWVNGRFIYDVWRIN